MGGGALVLLAVDGVLGFEVEMGDGAGSDQSDVVVDFDACRGGLNVLLLLQTVVSASALLRVLSKTATCTSSQVGSRRHIFLSTVSVSWGY